MPPTVDWATKVITVPQADLTLISGIVGVDGSLWECDTNELRLALKSIEDSEEGVPFERITRHNTEVTVAGATYARTIEVINNYRLFFEETGFDYTVRFIGSNNNFWETPTVLLPTPHVSYISTNSAGLIVTSQTGTGLLPSEAQDLADALAAAQKAEETTYGRKLMIESIDAIGSVPGYLIMWEQDGLTLIGHKEIWEDDAQTIGYRGAGIGYESELIAGLPPGYP